MVWGFLVPIHNVTSKAKEFAFWLTPRWFWYRCSVHHAWKNTASWTVVGRIMVPNDVSILISGAYKYVTLNEKSILQMELRLLIHWPIQREILLDYLGGSRVIKRVKMEEESRRGILPSEKGLRQQKQSSGWRDVRRARPALAGCRWRSQEMHVEGERIKETESHLPLALVS